MSLARPLTPRMKRALRLAEIRAAALGDNYIGVEHMAHAIFHEDDKATTDILTSLGLSRQDLAVKFDVAHGKMHQPQSPLSSEDLAKMLRDIANQLFPDL